MGSMFSSTSEVKSLPPQPNSNSNSLNPPSTSAEIFATEGSNKACFGAGCYW